MNKMLPHGKTAYFYLGALADNDEKVINALEQPEPILKLEEPDHDE